MLAGGAWQMLSRWRILLISVTGFSGITITMETLPPLAERFVAHFGEMARHWGMSRTVGQIYGLLYLSPKALNADEIVERLSLSRSNVSTGLKTLEDWRLVKLIHLKGDRREYFETPKEIWEVFRTLAEEKRRREVEPTLLFLREALQEDAQEEGERYAQARMRSMYDLIDLSSTWFDDVQKLSPASLERLMRMGSRVARVLDALTPPRRE
jgi:DNA-binding transcriptional regulator GbsR (MarR family)